MPLSPNSKFPLFSPPAFTAGYDIHGMRCPFGKLGSAVHTVSPALPCWFIGQHENKKALMLRKYCSAITKTSQNYCRFFLVTIQNIAPTMTKINFIPAKISVMSVQEIKLCFQKIECSYL